MIQPTILYLTLYHKMPRKSSLSKRLSKLERVSRPEVKFNQRESGAFDTIGSITGTILHPQTLAEGVGRNQRVGDKVKSRNIRFQAIMKMNSNSSTTTCAVRVLVLRSKQSDPTTSDMPTWYGSVDEDKFFVIKVGVFIYFGKKFLFGFVNFLVLILLGWFV